MMALCLPGPLQKCPVVSQMRLIVWASVTLCWLWQRPRGQEGKRVSVSSSNDRSLSPVECEDSDHQVADGFPRGGRHRKSSVLASAVDGPDLSVTDPNRPWGVCGREPTLSGPSLVVVLRLIS